MNRFKKPITKLSAWRAAGRKAFTLTELLVVMTIIAFMASTVAPALRGTLDGINLSGACETVTGQLSLARQTALTRNLSVEVRLYQADNGIGLVWNTIALVIPANVSGKSADEWLAPPKVLPGNIVFDPSVSESGESFSTVLISGTNTAPSDTNPNPNAPWAATESADAPRSLRELNYIAFRFQPDGSTNLPSHDASSIPMPWCLSLKNPLAKSTINTGNAPASNFVSFVIDPNTGRTLTFRP